MIEQRIKSLIDKRTFEATRKEISKKLQTIVKAFGKPIIEQTIPYTVIPNFWEVEAPEIPEVNDDNLYLRGYYFDGLSRGINLTVKLLMYDGRMGELRATWNGYQVYLDSEGDLRSYAPFPSWEDALDRLYTYAKPKAEEKIKEDKLKQREADKKKAMTIMERLRLLWGY